MRLRFFREVPNFDFFRLQWATLGFSGALVVLSLVAWVLIGLNFGIDFRGGTTIRTQSESAVDVGTYRQAMTPLELGDVTITEVFDPTFAENQHVAMIRIQAQDGQESVTQDTIDRIETALRAVDDTISFPLVESVGPKVSGELIWTAVLAVGASLAAILFYIWLRFEWQFSVGAVAALAHDVIVTIGIFSVLQIRFDLATIAALLTIIGYSINDTVVIFDRLRENLIKFKTTPLRDLMNLTANETLSRTLMTSGTTLLALIAMLILGGDVIRGFTFAMIWGVIIGTYSSIFVASVILLRLGVKRDWDKTDNAAGTQFADIDA